LLLRPKLYLLNDEFAYPLAAGAVNGTFARPGPGVRTVVDTNGKISIAAGRLDFATGAAINGAARYEVRARVPGRMLHWTVYPSDTNGIINLGWDANTSGAITDYLSFAAAGVLNIVANGGTAFAVGAYTAVAYEVIAMMRATGVLWLIRGGAFTRWTFLFPTTLGSAAGYPAIGAGSATSVFGADVARVPAGWGSLLPPIASDSFVRGNGALGISDGLGHSEANGGGGKTWVHDALAWAIVGNVAVGTPTPVAVLVTNADFAAWTADNPDGWSVVTEVPGANEISEVGTGEGYGGAGTGMCNLYRTTASVDIRQAVLAVGTWYRIGWMVDTVVGGACRVGDDAWSGSLYSGFVTTTGVKQLIGRAGGISIRIGPGNNGSNVTIDDVVVNALTLSSLFSSIEVGTPNVFRWQQISTLVSGTQGGLAVRLNDPVTPTSGIVAYMDGPNAKVDEFTAAATWTALVTAVKAFTANDWLGLWVSGANWRLYHMVDATGVVTLIGSGTTTVLTGNYASIFNTYNGNAFGKAVCFATGNEGQHESLGQVA
jgi:hypothetical protein